MTIIPVPYTTNKKKRLKKPKMLAGSKKLSSGASDKN